MRFLAHSLLLLAGICAGCAHYECEWLDGGKPDEYLPAEDDGGADDGAADDGDRSDNGDGESADVRSDDGGCIPVPETCNGLDDDCDGDVDEEPAALWCALPHAAASCTAGACSIASCEPGFADCDGDPANGCETNVRTLENCGGCGVVCNLNHAIETCRGEICELSECEYGWGDCDLDPSNGCETDILTDLANCGFCGVACHPRCVNGICDITQCDASHGSADCDGNPDTVCETNIFDDENNCNGCGLICDRNNASEICDVGVCRMLACDQGFGDCDGLDQNGCEIDLQSDPENCGHCGNQCDGGYLCQNGVCVPG